MPHEDRPILEYQTPPDREPQTPLGWFRRLFRGEDTFLGSSALLFAILTWASAVVALWAGAGAFVCGSFLVCMLSTLLAAVAFIEKGSSKTFPLVSLGSNALFLLFLFVRES